MSVPNQELHRIATTVIVCRDDNRFLITKRSSHKKAFPGLWTVPGGGLETDDYTKTKSQAAETWYGIIDTSLRREVREEVGLEIGKPQMIVDGAVIRPDGVPVLLLSYYAPYLSGEVVLDEDSVEFAWVTLEEARDYDLIDGIWSELAMTQRLLDGENPASVEFKYEG